MANITVSYEELENVAAQLDAGRSEIIERLRALQQQIHALVGSGFVTEQASKRFEASYSEYTASANTVVEKLSEIQLFIRQVAQSHQQMDAEIAARIN